MFRTMERCSSSWIFSLESIPISPCQVPLVISHCCDAGNGRLMSSTFLMGRQHLALLLLTMTTPELMA